MFFVSDIQTSAPATFGSSLQQEVYNVLGKLAIPFQRVDTDEAITMEDCAAINERLDLEMVKTLLLCNRQQTQHYLFVTRGDKPFRSKEFSRALDIARVSFAPVDHLRQLLGTPVGAATVLSVIRDTAQRVQVVIDAEVAAMSWYGCSDGTTTGYLKLRTRDVLHRYLAFAGHVARIVEV
ncbi:MAG: prolyl-tRNA synthetase associated domain-containing protein [Peptococcales bacterium]|jgi:Ala-tRNA(Pro) deacylase